MTYVFSNVAVTSEPSPPFAKEVAFPPVAVCNCLKFEVSVNKIVFPETSPVFISVTSSAVVNVVVGLESGVTVQIIADSVPVKSTLTVVSGLLAAAAVTNRKV